MRQQKIFSLTVLIINLTITSCASITYIGDTLSPTSNIDVFYESKDIKKDYKVIGHISAIPGANENKAKARIIEKSKAVGADCVIIPGLDYTGGKNSDPLDRADAIKYLP